MRSCGCRSIVGHGCRSEGRAQNGIDVASGNNDQVATINIFHILEISVKSGKDRVRTRVSSCMG